MKPRPSRHTAHPSAITEAGVLRVTGGAVERSPDAVVVEAPLAVEVVDGASREAVRLFTTMRTPGHDVELVRGMLLTEGVVQRMADLASIDAHDDGGVDTVRVELAPGCVLPERFAGRRVVRSSACGVCGAESLALVEGSVGRPLAPSDRRVPVALLTTLPSRMAEAQAGFRLTGGAHAAGLFTPDGALVALREDVGRHNALDKLLGAVVGGPVPIEACVLVLSSRASYELVQKAWVARIPVVAALGAPTSSAIDAARAAGITLIGFLGREGFNVYAGEDRIELAPWHLPEAERGGST